MRTRWIAATIGLGSLAAMRAIGLRDAAYVADVSRSLCAGRTCSGVFSEDMVADLPDPARRYFLHAIAPGTPLASRLRWNYTGEMKPGKDLPWMPLTAQQVLVAGRGFVWNASAGWGPLFVRVVDHYLDGDARMRIKVFGLLPILSASDDNIAQSAMGRLFIECFAMPSTMLPKDGVSIAPLDDNRFTVTFDHRGEQVTLTLTVDDAGQLQSIEMQRWGNITQDGSYQYIPYGATVTNEQTFAGYTIPTEANVGWWYGTPDYLEVVRLKVEDVALD